MALRRISPCPGKPTLQHAQLTDPVDVELFPPMRRPAATLATDLEAEQTLDATMDAVVMGLDDPDSSDSINEFDQVLVSNRAHEIVIHLQDQ